MIVHHYISEDYIFLLNEISNFPNQYTIIFIEPGKNLIKEIKITKNNPRFVFNQIVTQFVEKEDHICNKCKSKMIFRIGKYGPFWGCSQYPKCKGKENKEKKQTTRIEFDFDYIK